MKKVLALMLSAMLCLAFFTVAEAKEVKSFIPADINEGRENITESGDKTSGEYFSVKEGMTYFGIKNVDLTGVKSISIDAIIGMNGTNNGQILRIKVDDPYAESIGHIALNHYSPDKSVTVSGNIKEVSGVHNLYFATTLTKNTGDWKIKKITLNDEEYKTEPTTPDSAIVDFYSDTWVAVDDYGRKVSDFEETGPVKEGERDVAMFYWNWHVGLNETDNLVIPDVYREYPEAKNNMLHSAWGSMHSKGWWGEPIYGFYSSYDYFVYRKQAELFDLSGVDVLFFDYTNGTNCFIRPLICMIEAFDDAKAAGVNIPKLSAFCAMSNTNTTTYDQVMAIYYNIILDERYNDFWYYKDNLPYLVAYEPTNLTHSEVNYQDSDTVKMINEVAGKFNLRHCGRRDKSTGNDEYVHWLDSYPQPVRGYIMEDGRNEWMAVGMAINESYVDHGAKTGVFSDPYSKGKGYSEAFGEDYSADCARKPYFFREQAALSLEADPHIMFVDGWNEWNTVKYTEYSGYKNAFVDLCDEEGSRDFEPSRSYIKDDYFNLLVDFTRKYKGVRPAPVASAEKTIDIEGDAKVWSDVAPEFLNYNGEYGRDEIGFLDKETGKSLHYTSTTYNSVVKSKVARDKDNFYFYAETAEDLVESPAWMHLYINADRNIATGWIGYDYAVNVNGKGVVSKYENGTWINIGTAALKESGKVLQLSFARSLIGETGIVDIEFKWTDNFTGTDYLDFYDKASVAPAGKFNYLYTEIQQTALTSDERKALSKTTIVKTGSNKMIIDGGKVGVFEADTRITPFEANGTVYVPFMTYEDILGYGYAKVEYDSEDNILYMARHDLSEDKREITNYQWTYNEIGTLAARINGREVSLSKPVMVVDGLIYVPLTYVSDTFGWNIKSFGNGVYALSRNAIDDNLILSVVSHIE